MKIIRLESENVKRVRAVTIEPNGAVVTVRGNNAQGKSSVLDSIAYGLGGKSLIPAKVIRDGEREAVVRIELDGLSIERKWKSDNSSTLEVRAADGSKVASPQTALDELVGRMSFDPLSYLTLKPEKQLEVLQKLVGLDFRILDESRKKAYDERTEVNRRIHHSEIRLQPLREFGDLEVVSVADLSEKLQQLVQANGQQQEAARALQRLDKERAEAKRRVASQEERVASLVRELEHARTQLADMRIDAERLEGTDTTELSKSAALAKESAAQIDAVRAQIRDAEKTNERARKVVERKELEKVLEEIRGESEALTAQIDKIDAQKRAAIEAAKFPVPGLSFSEKGVLFNGQPFESASQAERLRVSLAMGIALNPTIRVLLIRDASLLDENNLRLVAQMAEEAGAQVWLEVVGKHGPGVIIEDGEVEAVVADDEGMPV